MMVVYIASAAFLASAMIYAWKKGKPVKRPNVDAEQRKVRERVRHANQWNSITTAR